MFEENAVENKLSKISKLILKADGIYQKFRTSKIVSNSEIEKLNNILLKLGSMDDEVEDKNELVKFRRSIIAMITDMTNSLNDQTGIVI